MQIGAEMPFQPVPDAASVTMTFTMNDGETAQNIFHVVKGSAWGADELARLADQFVTWYEGAEDFPHPYSEHMSENSHLTAVLARALDAEGAPEGTPTLAIPTTGGADGTTQLQNGLTFTITHRTGLAGRSFRGRTYVPCLSTNSVFEVGANAIKPTYAADLVASFRQLRDLLNLADATWHLAVVSRYHNGVARAAGVSTPVVDFGYSDIYLDFQRRRAPGHNRHH